jgi:hypothetical protein
MYIWKWIHLLQVVLLLVTVKLRKELVACISLIVFFMQEMTSFKANFMLVPMEEAQ